MYACFDNTIKYVYILIHKTYQNSASLWWANGIIGTELDSMPRTVILDWTSQIDNSVYAGEAPKNLFELPLEAIATFPVERMFRGTNSNIERHFGVKLEDKELVFSVAGVLSSNSGAYDPTKPWVTAPGPPPHLKQKDGVLNENSVRMYVCIFAGKRAGGFMRFTGSRPLRSKENTAVADTETVLECPSWFAVLAWSDHKCEVKIPPPSLGREDDHDTHFYVLALDISKQVFATVLLPQQLSLLLS
jgi:hypothetical protein